jgi:hypothetical protein
LKKGGNEEMKRILYALLICGLLFLVSCSNTTISEDLQDGFNYLNEEVSEVQTVFCGYYMDFNEQQIGDVSAQFYIGIPEEAFYKEDDLSSINIYAISSSSDKVILYTITDYKTTDFEYNVIDNLNGTITIEYSYIENIVIPETLFIENGSHIELGFDVMVDVDGFGETVHFSTWQDISYEIVNGRLKLQN